MSVYERNQESYKDKIEEVEYQLNRPLRITEKLVLFLTFMEEDLWGEENGGEEYYAQR